ncbi:hypothetical protein V6N13_033094 [Hibiscus sabdariffa]|uniref:Uncharacterized protein n=1 Tax=Hibiscus sabdariffa TaxID=183260 RepID=A0ABR2FBD5_9ROSI
MPATALLRWWRAALAAEKLKLRIHIEFHPCLGVNNNSTVTFLNRRCGTSTIILYSKHTRLMGRNSDASSRQSSLESMQSDIANLYNPHATKYGLLRQSNLISFDMVWHLQLLLSESGRRPDSRFEVIGYGHADRLERKEFVTCSRKMDPIAHSASAVHLTYNL